MTYSVWNSIVGRRSVIDTVVFVRASGLGCVSADMGEAKGSFVITSGRCAGTEAVVPGLERLLDVTDRPRPSGLPKHLVLDGHRVEVSEAFWTYLYVGAERQRMFFRRVEAQPAPWTEDPILSAHRFTNAYRASDRVSQYLLQNVVYDKARDSNDVIFRVLLFKMFNRIDTWEYLCERVGDPSVDTFDAADYAVVLDDRFRANARLYSAAYIMPSPAFGQVRKHANHLHLLEALVRTGTVERFADASSLRDLFEQLLAVPSFGPFLAFQYAIDLNYADCFSFDEMSFVVAGPGAIRGVGKCFVSTGGLTVEGVIRAVTNTAPELFERLGLQFRDLWGRPLQLIDCQNLFCETDKYTRVSLPHLANGGPTRIKQNYSPDPHPLSIGYPPKWRLPHTATSPTPIGPLSINPTRL